MTRCCFFFYMCILEANKVFITADNIRLVYDWCRFFFSLSWIKSNRFDIIANLQSRLVQQVLPFNNKQENSAN